MEIANPAVAAAVLVLPLPLEPEEAADARIWAGRCFMQLKIHQTNGVMIPLTVSNHMSPNVLFIAGDDISGMYVKTCLVCQRILVVGPDTGWQRWRW